jgi:hypothetical protein
VFRLQVDSLTKYLFFKTFDFISIFLIINVHTLINAAFNWSCACCRMKGLTTIYCFLCLGDLVHFAQAVRMEWKLRPDREGAAAQPSDRIPVLNPHHRSYVTDASGRGAADIGEARQNSGSAAHGFIRRSAVAMLRTGAPW